MRTTTTITFERKGIEFDIRAVCYVEGRHVDIDSVVVVKTGREFRLELTQWERLAIEDSAREYEDDSDIYAAEEAWEAARELDESV